MTKPVLRVKVRPMLMNLRVGQSLISPMRYKDTIYQERTDLTLFHGYEFKGRFDKVQNKQITKRIA